MAGMRKIPARFAALCVPGYGKVSSLRDDGCATRNGMLYSAKGCVEVLSFRGFHAERYLTVSDVPAEWLVRAGAYWHCSEAIPLVYVPALLA